MKNLIVEKCKNCGKDFEKRDERRNGKHSLSEIRLRRVDSVTCSDKCSKEWLRKSRYKQ